MKILAISEFYDPDPAAGQRVSEALTYLAARGHTVSVFASRSRYQGGGAVPADERRQGVWVRRLWTPIRSGTGMWRKTAASWTFQSVALLRALVGRGRFDVLLTVSTPPMAHVAGCWVARLRGFRHVLWSADVHPDSAVRLGLLRHGSWAARFLEWLSRSALRRCDAIVAVGRCMGRLLIEKGVAPQRVRVIPMWHRDELAEPPPEGAIQALRSRLGLDGAFLAMYSGNLGRMHGLDELLEAARRLDPTPGLVLLIAGAGAGLEKVRGFAQTRGLRSLRVRGLFAEQELGAALGAADVHVITLDRRMSGISVPGKLYGAMASGRPVVFAGPADSEAALTIQEEGCGLVVDGAEGLVAALGALRERPAWARELGERGRMAFLARHTLSHRCAEWERLLRQIAVEQDAPRVLNRFGDFACSAAEIRSLWSRLGNGRLQTVTEPRPEGAVTRTGLRQESLSTRAPLPRGYRWKLALEWVAALAALAILSPLLAAVAAVVALDSPGPILFRQARLGRGGRVFTMYKFRTLRWDPNSRPRLRPDGSTEVSGDDGRLTRAGRWLRLGWDELPQLWNVLRGDMTLIGPRPDEPFHAAYYTTEERRKLAVPPGITGWPQVLGRAEIPWKERIRMDLEYIDHYSPARDAWIAARSAWLILNPRRAGRDA